MVWSIKTPQQLMRITPRYDYIFKLAQAIQGTGTIMGGCALSIFKGYTFNDIDIYCVKEKGIAKLVKHVTEFFSSNGFRVHLNTSKYARNLICKKGKIKYKVQIIVPNKHPLRFGSPEDITAEFDIDVCMCWIDENSEVKFINPQARRNAVGNTFNLVNSHDPVVALQRILKYSRKGFSCMNEHQIIQQIVSSTVKCINIGIDVSDVSNYINRDFDDYAPQDGYEESIVKVVNRKQPEDIAVFSEYNHVQKVIRTHSKGSDTLKSKKTPQATVINLEDW